MRLLLDTHVLIWLALSPQRLTAAEQALLAAASESALVSSVTIWELRLKWDRRGPSAREELLEPTMALGFAEQHGFELAALTPGDCATSLGQPLAHRDPFDEMLLIHAQRLGARLLTRDRQLAGHPLALAPG